MIRKLFGSNPWPLAIGYPAGTHWPQPAFFKRTAVTGTIARVTQRKTPRHDFSQAMTVSGSNRATAFWNAEHVRVVTESHSECPSVFKSSRPQSSPHAPHPSRCKATGRVGQQRVSDRGSRKIPKYSAHLFIQPSRRTTDGHASRNRPRRENHASGPSSLASRAENYPAAQTMVTDSQAKSFTGGSYRRGVVAGDDRVHFSEKKP